MYIGPETYLEDPGAWVSQKGATYLPGFDSLVAKNKTQWYSPSDDSCLFNGLSILGMDNK